MISSRIQIDIYYKRVAQLSRRLHERCSSPALLRKHSSNVVILGFSTAGRRRQRAKPRVTVASRPTEAGKGWRSKNSFWGCTAHQCSIQALLLLFPGFGREYRGCEIHAHHFQGRGLTTGFLFGSNRGRDDLGPRRRLVDALLCFFLALLGIEGSGKSIRFFYFVIVS